jgi:hypothetical protein
VGLTLFAITLQSVRARLVVVEVGFQLRDLAFDTFFTHVPPLCLRACFPSFLFATEMPTPLDRYLLLLDPFQSVRLSIECDGLVGLALSPHPRRVADAASRADSFENCAHYRLPPKI